MRRIVYISVLFVLVSCNKFLDEKPDIAWQEPQTLDDLQALLNNENSVNAFQPSIGDIASDYYYLNQQNYNSREANVRLMHAWDGNTLTENTWSFSFSRIFNLNLVLDNIDKVSVGKMSEMDRNKIKGTAYFLRAFNYFQLATIFAPQYRESNKNVLTIPIKKSADINEVIELATMEELYDFIEEDMKTAINLLPNSTLFQTQPTKLAGKILLSRFFMSVGNWEEAALLFTEIDEVVSLLIDFNTLQKNAAVPFQRFNKETIFYSTISGQESVFAPSISNVPIWLFDLYEESDLRKGLFFTGPQTNIRFKGSYTGANSATLFGGITVGELLLNYSEIMVRVGEIEKGIEVLNSLLRKRYITNGFIDYPVLAKEEALELLKDERIKELCFKGGIRWMDLKRYAAESDEGYVITREIGEQVFNIDLKENSNPFKLPPVVGK